MIQQWIHKGIQDSINSAFRDSYSYGAGSKIKDMMLKILDKVMKECEGEIEKAVREGILKAVVSPGFLQVMEKDIANSFASAYHGAFKAVILSAAKQAANTEVIAQRVVELTKIAAGAIEP